MQRDARHAVPMMVRLVFSVLLVLGAAGAGSAQQPPPDGWVVIPVEDYRALRALAYPPTRPPDPPPVDAAMTQNVVNMQRKVASVLPVRVDVPRAGTAYQFVRPLVLNEETSVSFRYKRK